MVVTVINPGAMGIAIARSVQRSGAAVRAVVHNRSQETQDRANGAGLDCRATLEAALESSDVVLSVCPPHAAVDVARQVANLGYSGIYADCNAISPQRTHEVQDIITQNPAQFVDGGIVGGPPKDREQTFLYLSGEEEPTATVKALFTEGLIESSIVSSVIGDASALKMCYAAYTKGSTALLLAIVGAAEKLGVRESLENQWVHEGSGLKETAHKRASFAPKKAWRWIDEMEEIANTFQNVDSPPGFHRAAADVYRTIEHLRPTDDNLPTPEEVIKALGAKDG